jgi:hypothetical protein
MKYIIDRLQENHRWCFWGTLLYLVCMIDKLDGDNAGVLFVVLWLTYYVFWMVLYLVLDVIKDGIVKLFKK